MKTLAVHHWPATGAATGMIGWDGELLALATTVPAGADRAGARADIRAAVCEVAALLTGIGAERIEVTATPGSAPRLLIDGVDAGIGLSISHADTVSVALLRRGGTVGVDVMRIGLSSDWARVAHQYLGMATATLLAASNEELRPRAFCRAWAGREAQLKLRGEALREWRAGDAGGDVRRVDLALADGLVGVAAFD